MTDRIFLSAPSMGGDEKRLIGEAIDASEIALGRHLADLEKRLAEQAGVRAAAAVASGTAALHLAYDVLGIGPGDLVFCSSLTFVATVAPACQLGATPVFIDCEPESWNMSPRALERAFADAAKNNRMPKAVVVASIYGQSADFDPLSKICDRFGVPVVEDAAEVLGATYRDRPCGGLGAIGIYSFNGNKIISTGGGGAVLCDDEETIRRIRFLSGQARDPGWHYEHTRLGYNYRMSNIAAAMGMAQMDRLEDRIARRQEIFARYRAALGDIDGIGFMPVAGYGRHTCWLSVISIEPRPGRPAIPEICAALDGQAIEARPVWKPLHRQPVFDGSAYFSHGENESVSEQVFANGLCLPAGPDVTDAVQDRVIAALRSALGAS